MRAEAMMDKAPRPSNSSLAAFAFRVFLGGMFIYTGTIHALDPQGFAVAVANYRILPAALVHPFAVLLPWIELIAGGLLVSGIFVQGSSLIITGLLFMFAIALGMALVTGLDISCGCFTTSKDAQRISWQYLARDAGLLAMALFVFFLDTGVASLSNIRGMKR